MTTTTYEPGQPERDDLPTEAPDIELLSTESAAPVAPVAEDVDPADPATEPTD